MLPKWNASAKGKVHKRYEFGCKTSVATTSKSNWIVGAQALHGNPYDGHTLGGAIRQVERLTGHSPHDVMVDQGYRGHGYAGSASVHVVRSIPKRATRALRRMLKRRAAIEPTIGHLKSDNRLNRNYLLIYGSCFSLADDFCSRSDDALSLSEDDCESLVESLSVRSEDRFESLRS